MLAVYHSDSFRNQVIQKRRIANNTLAIQMPIADYYHTLEISRHATNEEIKQAYRKLAKRYHPDKNPGREKSAGQMFRLICIAYEILRDSQRKLKYDLTLRVTERKLEQRARHFENLRRSTQIQHKYQLMFQDFLNENIEAGLQIYEQLKREEKKFCMDDFFNYQDSRDCEFLIAEAYQRLGDYRTAIEIYESLIQYEKRRPCFHHFIDEIKDRLKRIYFHCLTNPRSLEDIPNDLDKISALNLSKREMAWIYKKLAEFYVDINWLTQAKKMLRMAFELYPRLAGAKKICQQLGMEYWMQAGRYGESL